MKPFHYIAINSQGKKLKGIIEADSEKSARQLLREQKLSPLSVSDKETSFSFSFLKWFKNKKMLSQKNLALLTRQFATLLASGLPLEEVLATTALQMEKPIIQRLILSLRNKIAEGYSFAKALSDFPETFSSLYCATVASGEASGHLDQALHQLADYTEKQYETRQTIQHACIYPIMMIIVSISIVGFLLDYVVPKMIAIYSNLNQTLPLMTRFLIALSQGIQTFGLYIFIASIVGVFFFFQRYRTRLSFREKIDTLLLRIPLIGNFIILNNTARFARTLSILSRAGVPLLDSLKMASELVTHLPIQNALKKASDRIKEGANIYLSLKQTQFFTPISLHLIASGETSGELETMLDRAAEHQENDIARFIKTSLSLLEPIIILVMGAIVLFIVLAVLLPIFQLDQLGQ